MARLDVNEVEISSFTESSERFVQVYSHNSHVFAVNDCGSIFAFNSEGTDSYPWFWENKNFIFDFVV